MNGMAGVVAMVVVSGATSQQPPLATRTALPESDSAFTAWIATHPDQARDTLRSLLARSTTIDSSSAAELLARAARASG